MFRFFIQLLSQPAKRDWRIQLACFFFHIFFMLCSFVSRETFFCLWQNLNKYVMTRRAVLSKRLNRIILPMAKFEQLRYNKTRFMERCPSGLRSWSWKPVMRQRTVGSNPTLSARIIKASELFAWKPFCVEKTFCSECFRIFLNVDSTIAGRS